MERAKAQEKRNPKGGRPKKSGEPRSEFHGRKPDGRTRTSSVASVRANLTLSEKAILHAKAQAAGLSEAEYVRRRILGDRALPSSEPVRVASALDKSALISELNRIGVNVNQLARAVHRGSDFVSYWRDVGRRLEEVMARVARPE